METTKLISIEDYTYELPEGRIAKYPLSDRSASRLLVYRAGEITEGSFAELGESLPAGCVLVRNDSRVIRARLLFRRATGAEVEVFCLDPIEPTSYEGALGAHGSATWHCMLGNARRWRAGEQLVAEVAHGEGGAVRLTAERVGEGTVRFEWDNGAYTFGDVLEALGILPLPPYLNRETEAEDHTTYQTVYAAHAGSVAAPTAGLHFTPEVFGGLAARGVEVLDVTLHVGAGTFRPVKSATIGGHEMHSEWVSVRRETIARLGQSLGRIVAVGTTSVRTLESLYHLGRIVWSDPTLRPEQLAVGQWTPYDEAEHLDSTVALDALLAYMERWGLERVDFATAILIAPGYRFRIVDGLVTNFHQPGSTLLLLIAAFLGEDWRRVYDYALREGFRFLSYGDSSLLLPHG